MSEHFYRSVRVICDSICSCSLCRACSLRWSSLACSVAVRSARLAVHACDQWPGSEHDQHTRKACMRDGTKQTKKLRTYLDQVAGRANEHRQDDRDGVHRQRLRVAVALLPSPMAAHTASIDVLIRRWLRQCLSTAVHMR